MSHDGAPMTGTASPNARRPLSTYGTASSSYQQPLGASSSLRGAANGRKYRSGSVGSLYSHSQDENRRQSLPSPAGKRRRVFCDVVLDGVKENEDGNWTFPEQTRKFVSSLGSPIEDSTLQVGSFTGLPSTPVKPGPVNPEKACQALRELWSTEASYLRKVVSLHQDYAVPLRTFAKNKSTAIISQFEAAHLFMNVEFLVPIAVAFEEDLNYLVQEMGRNGKVIPANTGRIIRHHVEQMAPFKKFLANVPHAESIYKALSKSNSSFNEFIERTQVHSRESAQATGGFREFLAEPFQRVSRYRLMIDPMIRHLHPQDENVVHLTAAAELLSEICSMQVDEATQRAATMWSLNETIDGFPPALIGFERHLVCSIDVDEIVESSTSSSASLLRCTVFLFSDHLLIAKRPSGDKGGKQLSGLDDLDGLIVLYQTSHLTNTQSAMLGSPQKLKRGSMGFRGVMKLLEIRSIDLGGDEFGLVFDRPPADQSERWCGRPARRYAVAPMIASDVRRAEKNVFLDSLAETQCILKHTKGMAIGKKSCPVASHPGQDSDMTVVYWSIWGRSQWEKGHLSSKGPFALHIDEIGDAADLSFEAEVGPKVVVKVNFLPENRCRFIVRLRDSPNRDSEIISLERVIPAIAEIGSGYGLADFPSTPAGNFSDAPKGRPRSLLLSAAAALDVFGSGSSLMRGHSMTSKTSNATSTSWSSGKLSGSIFSSLSPRASTSAKRSSKQSLPGYGRLGARSVADLRTGVEMVEEEEQSVQSRSKQISSEQTEISADQSRPVSRRRSVSMPPPPQTKSDWPSLEQLAEEKDTETIRARRTVAIRSFDNENNVGTSPMEYRPAVTGGRRRLMGPREIGSPSKMPAALSPMPKSAQLNMLLSPEKDNRITRSPSRTPQGSSATYNLNVPPSRMQSPTPSSSSSMGKRPLIEGSPRATPAKKIATVVNSGSSNNSPSPVNQSVRTGWTSSTTSLRANLRAPSEASTVRGASPLRKEDLSSSSLSRTKKRKYSLSMTTSLPVLERGMVHIEHLKSLLSTADAADKENDEPAGKKHFKGLPRSPPTQDIFLKARRSNSSFSSLSEDQLVSISQAELSLWIEQLMELMEQLDERHKATESTDTALVEAERDLLQAELVRMRNELEKATADLVQSTRMVKTLEKQKDTLSTLYKEMVDEANSLYKDFRESLDKVGDLSPNSPEQQRKMAAELRSSILAKTELQATVRKLNRELAFEKAERLKLSQDLPDS